MSHPGPDEASEPQPSEPDTSEAPEVGAEEAASADATPSEEVAGEAGLGDAGDGVGGVQGLEDELIVPDDLSGLDQSLTPPPPGPDDVPISVEDLVETLERVSVERDEFRDGLLRKQAEFENYRKAVAKREIDARERANEAFALELLPVMDACDGAIANGATDVEPIRSQLILALERQGLARLEPADAPFDPEQHDAVMHEPDDDVEVPTVAEVLRIGYSLRGRVIRPAMVKVKG